MHARLRDTGKRKGGSRGCTLRDSVPARVTPSAYRAGRASGRRPPQERLLSDPQHRLCRAAGALSGLWPRRQGLEACSGDSWREAPPQPAQASTLLLPALGSAGVGLPRGWAEGQRAPLRPCWAELAPVASFACQQPGCGVRPSLLRGQGSQSHGVIHMGPLKAPL